MSGAHLDQDARTVVIGVGNPFRSDDGVGHRVAQLVQEELRHPERAEVVLSDGEASRLLDIWAGADLVVVVDAVVTGAAPGQVQVWEAGRQSLPVRGATSTHATGVAEAWALGDALGTLPGRLLVVGIEGACFDDGTDLSEPVAAAVSVAHRLVREAIAQQRPAPGRILGAAPAEEPG